MTCSQCHRRTTICAPCLWVYGKPPECLCEAPVCKRCWVLTEANAPASGEPPELKHRSQEAGLFG